LNIFQERSSIEIVNNILHNHDWTQIKNIDFNDMEFFLHNAVAGTVHHMIGDLMKVYDSTNVDERRIVVRPVVDVSVYAVSKWLLEETRHFAGVVMVNPDELEYMVHVQNRGGGSRPLLDHWDGSQDACSRVDMVIELLLLIVDERTGMRTSRLPIGEHDASLHARDIMSQYHDMFRDLQPVFTMMLVEDIRLVLGDIRDELDTLDAIAQSLVRQRLPDTGEVTWHFPGGTVCAQIVGDGDEALARHIDAFHDNGAAEIVVDDHDLYRPRVRHRALV
jgi:hypothetical protein